METATPLEWTAAADRLGELLSQCDASVLDRAECERAVAAIAGLRRRLDACEVRLARRLRDLADADPRAPSAEDVLAAGGRTDVRAAEQVTVRAGALDHVPQLAACLDAGDVSGEHVDAVAGVLRRFTPERRTEFGARHGDALGRAGWHLRRRVSCASSRGRSPDGSNATPKRSTGSTSNAAPTGCDCGRTTPPGWSGSPGSWIPNGVRR